MLGQAEKYMKVMTGFGTAAKRIQVMIYKQQFKSRVGECCTTLSSIENACDDVKMSVRLKKVLKTILKVGNQMNDGEDHLGFTLDSLLKLQSAKAFDKKTSILQYVIMLIYRNDEKCLNFPDELKHCAEASRLTLDSAQQEQMALRQGLEASLRVITEIKTEDTAKNVQSSSTAMAFFLVKARQSLEELDLKIENVRNKFSNVLAYFGEEAAMASQDFFSTLTKFVQVRKDFIFYFLFLILFYDHLFEDFQIFTFSVLSFIFIFKSLHLYLFIFIHIHFFHFILISFLPFDVTYFLY